MVSEGKLTSIDGTGITDRGDIAGDSGLVLQGPGSSGSTITRMAIYGFRGSGIATIDSADNTILSNRLGIDSAYVIPEIRMSEGILVNGGSNNRIGAVQQFNTIGGAESGIRITGGAVATIIEGNAIGVPITWDSTHIFPNRNGLLVESGFATIINANSIGGNTGMGSNSRQVRHKPK